MPLFASSALARSELAETAVTACDARFALQNASDSRRGGFGLQACIRRVPWRRAWRLPSANAARLLQRSGAHEG